MKAIDKTIARLREKFIMRLADILSKPLSSKFEQVDNFLGKSHLKQGKQKKIDVGVVALTYHCNNCNDDLTLASAQELFCIGITERLISIDCVLSCPRCKSMIPIWFLVESEDDMCSVAPKVRVLKRTERFTEHVSLSTNRYGVYSELLEKADKAFRDELGAGCIVYLRKILEKVTKQVAIAESIELSITTKNGKRKDKTFRDLLEEVDKKHSIIPEEFSANGYKLFGELSNIVHSNNDDDEQNGLKKYESLHRLVVGILEKVKNNKEIMTAIGELGWNIESGETEWLK